MFRNRALAAIGAAVVVVSTAACQGQTSAGEGDDQETGNGSGGAVEASLGVFSAPTVMQAGLAWGQFDELSLSPTVIDSGPAALPLISRGDMAGIVDLSATPLLIAETSDIPLEIVWMTSGATYSLVVAGEGIEDAEDLVGKNIAIVPGSILEYVLDQYMVSNGQDPASVNKVDLPPPSMPAAFSTGQIDGAYVWEPFAGQMVDGGGNVIDQASDRGLVAMGADFVADHPEEVQLLVCGLAASHERFFEDPEAAYEVIAEGIGAEADVVAASMPADSVLPVDQATPDVLGDGSEPSSFASQIVDVGQWLADQGKISRAPELAEIEELFNPSFAEAEAAGECSA
jgi:taurine transport system substrate-binding protein